VSVRRHASLFCDNEGCGEWIDSDGPDDSAKSLRKAATRSGWTRPLMTATGKRVDWCHRHGKGTGG